MIIGGLFVASWVENTRVVLNSAIRIVFQISDS